MKRDHLRHTVGIVTIAMFAVALWQPTTSRALENDKGWLGVGVKEMTPSMRNEYDLGDRVGLLVTHVERNSPADEAALWEDDVILRYADQSVQIIDEFAELVRETTPGTKVAMLIWRNKREKQLEVEVGRDRASRLPAMCWNSNEFRIMLDQPSLGVDAHDLNADLAQYFDVKENSGVLISQVHEDTPAEKAGLKAGDVITKIDDEEIRDRLDLLDVLRDYEDGDVVTVEFVRKGKTQKVQVELQAPHFSRLRIEGLEPWIPRLRMHRFERERLPDPPRPFHFRNRVIVERRGESI